MTISDSEYLLRIRSIESKAAADRETKTILEELINQIQKDDKLAVQSLIDSGAPVNDVFEDQISPLGVAAAEGNVDMIKILRDSGAVLSIRFDGGKDAAWLAMENSKYQAFDTLIDMGAKINIRLRDTSETRLIAAVKNSDLRIVKRLVDRKINVNDFDIERKTALHYNLAKDPYEVDDMEIGRILLYSGCNPNERDIDDVPAHEYAITDNAKTLLAGYELEKVSEAAMRRKQLRDLKAEQKAAEAYKKEPEYKQPKMKKPGAPKKKNGRI